MFFAMKKLILYCLIMSSFGTCLGNILYWQVGPGGGPGDAYVEDNGQIYKMAVFVGNKALNGSQDADYDAGIDYVIRVKGISNDGRIVYLDTHYGFDADGVDLGWSGQDFNGMPIGDWGSGHYSTGPNASKLTSDEVDYDIQSGQKWKLMMELGRATWNEDYTEADYVILAETLQYDADDILAAHAMEEFSVAPPVDMWAPTMFYAESTIPEPSIVFLEIIGISFLLLRRKHMS